MTARRDALVVGAGVNGLAIAIELARLDWTVRVVEQRPEQGRQGASEAGTRYLRWAHGPNVEYAQLSSQSLAAWDELARQTGTRLFDSTGVAWIIRADDPWLAASLAVMDDLGRASVVVDGHDAQRWLPGVTLDDAECLLVETDAGLLRARSAVAALRQRAIQAGVTTVSGRAAPKDGAVLVDGETLDADLVVWAVGAWLSNLFPGVTPAVATRQDVLHFVPPTPWRSGLTPWIDFSAGVYGALDPDGSLKVACDRPGRSVMIEEDDQPDRNDSEDLCRRHVAGRFPSARLGSTLRQETCHYGLTEDAEWIVARHPIHDSTWLIGGDSGHGFKHGPLLGSQVAGWIDRGEDPPARWSLGARSTLSSPLRTGPGGSRDE